MSTANNTAFASFSGRYKTLAGWNNNQFLPKRYFHTYSELIHADATVAERIFHALALFEKCNLYDTEWIKRVNLVPVLSSKY